MSLLELLRETDIFTEK